MLRSITILACFLPLGQMASTFCPDLCPGVFKPVCGSDGTTYSHECVLKRAACGRSSLYQVHEGFCETKTNCSEICFAIDRSVCGTDGETYSSSCHLRNEACRSPHLNLAIIDSVPCGPKRECPDACTEQYEPVCGSDNKTYDNSCKLGVTACRNPYPYLSIVHDGPCVN